MPETRTGIAMEFEPGRALARRYRNGCTRYSKPGLSREVLFSLLMCFPVTCTLWGVIIYGAFRLAR